MCKLLVKFLFENYNQRVKFLANAFFLYPNIEIPVCQKNIWLSAIHNLVSESVCNFFSQKALKFCPRYLFNNYNC